MTGARFVHDRLEELGWDVLIADAAKVKGLAPLACKTDRIDARVLAVLSERDLVPEIWLPDPRVRREREQARFRMHLVKHRSMLKHRIHATLITFGHPCPVSDLFGVAGRELLERLAIPQPWRGTVDASLALIGDLDRQIDAINKDLRCGGADHPHVPLLLTVPGIGWVLAFTIAAEIGDIRRFASAKKLCGYTGLCPHVNQSGDRDRRGPLSKQGPKYRCRPSFPAQSRPWPPLPFVSMKKGVLSTALMLWALLPFKLWVVASGAHLSIACSAAGPGDIGGRLRGLKSKRAVRRPDEKWSLHRARATRLQAARTPSAEIYPQALPALWVEDVHEPVLCEHDLDGRLALVQGSQDASANLASLSDREAARTV